MSRLIKYFALNRKSQLLTILINSLLASLILIILALLLIQYFVVLSLILILLSLSLFSYALIRLSKIVSLNNFNLVILKTIWDIETSLIEIVADLNHTASRVITTPSFSLQNIARSNNVLKAFDIIIQNSSAFEQKLNSFEQYLSASLPKNFIIDSYGKDIVNKYYIAQIVNKNFYNGQAIKNLNEFNEKYNCKTSSYVYQISRHTIDSRVCPHLLISAKSGYGKTNLIKLLITQQLQKDAELLIVDPKNELTNLKNILGSDNVVTEKEEILKLLSRLLATCKNRQNYLTVNQFYSPEEVFPAVYLIFDEILAFMLSLQKKSEKDEVNSLLSQLILLGRSAGVFVIVASQKFTNDALSKAVRESLSVRIALGNHSRTALEGAGFEIHNFDTHDTVFQKGEGYILTDLDTRPKLIQTDKIDFDITAEFSTVVSSS